jgi:hypothetical protein
MRRRRSFVVVIGLTAVALVVLFRPGGGTAPPVDAASPARSSEPTITPSPSAETTTAVDAWLAWMPGGFPAGFRSRIAHGDGLSTVAVVAGDTLWMTASHDASGAVVDRPEPPYRIPIDAFAVDPSDYAPFVPAADRARITAALSAGRAVLGQRSADLRQLGPGGTISFGADSVEVGAIVPDDDVGWSELLVSRDVGARLGIAHDRYLLALGDAGLTMARFTADVRALIPADEPLRTVPPGGTRFVRVASGVDPPIVMKEVFGEFAAYPQSSDPAYLTMSTSWYDAHISTRSVPVLGQVTCNDALFPMLVGALHDVQEAGLSGELHVYSGCYAARTVARSTIAPPSQHAYGAAIDINAPENPYGGTPTMDPKIVRIFEHWGFNWGGDFLIPDGMHFEYGRPPP